MVRRCEKGVRNGSSCKGLADLPENDMLVVEIDRLRYTHAEEELRPVSARPRFGRAYGEDACGDERKAYM